MTGTSWTVLVVGVVLVILGIALTLWEFYGNFPVQPARWLVVSAAGVLVVCCGFPVVKPRTQTCTVTAAKELPGAYEISTRQCGPLITRDRPTVDKLETGRTYRITMTGGQLFFDTFIVKVEP